MNSSNNFIFNSVNSIGSTQFPSTLQGISLCFIPLGFCFVLFSVLLSIEFASFSHYQWLFNKIEESVLRLHAQFVVWKCWWWFLVLFSIKLENSNTFISIVIHLYTILLSVFVRDLTMLLFSLSHSFSPPHFSVCMCVLVLVINRTLESGTNNKWNYFGDCLIEIHTECCTLFECQRVFGVIAVEFQWFIIVCYVVFWLFELFTMLTLNLDNCIDKQIIIIIIVPL